MTKEEWYRQLFEHLSASKFRSSFHLKQKDIAYIKEKGLDVIREHARDFIAKREAPAVIPNDLYRRPRIVRQSPGGRSGRNQRLLPGVYSEVAQDTAGERTESGAAGLSGGCDYDLNRKRVVTL